MKLEVGMYVRTKYGIAKYIHKLITKATIYYVIDKKIVYENMEDWEDVLLSNEIIKASHNIIDLIEENDLLEIEYYSPRYEERVTRLFEVDFKHKNNITFGNVHCQLNIFDGEWDKHDQLLEPAIKTIVTKEQFESISYEVSK